MPQLLDLRSRVWYNPHMSSIFLNIPGLIGVILQTVTLMLTSFSIVIERERGTMEQLEQYKEFAILVAFGIVFLAIATLKFKKKID